MATVLLVALVIWLQGVGRVASQEPSATPDVGTTPAQVRATATAFAHENPDIWLRLRDGKGLFGRAEVRIDAWLRIPMQGELEVVIFDDDLDRKKTYIVRFSNVQNEYTSMSWKYPISTNAIGRQNEIDRLTAQFIPEDGDQITFICRQHSSSDSEYGVHSCVAESGGILVGFVQATATAEILTAVARQTQTASTHQTSTAHAPTAAVQTRTAIAQHTATAHANWTATVVSQRTATAFSSTSAAVTRTARALSTATARANRTATAVSRQTETAHRATAHARQTATTYARTATAFARGETATASVSTAIAQQTATASARPTSTPRPTTYYVRHSSLVNVRACASTSCALVGTIPPGQAIAVLREETGAPVNGDTRWLAFIFEGQTRYLHASLATVTQPTTTPRPTNTPQPTRTPRATATTAINLQPSRTYYVSSSVGANARPCPMLTESCASVRRFNFREAISVIGEAIGDSYQGSTRWKVVEVGNQRMYIHATLLSLNRPPAATNTESSTAGSGASGNGRGGSNTGAPFVRGSCRVVRERTGQCGFRPGDPNYNRGRDRDEDGIACEC